MSSSDSPSKRERQKQRRGAKLEQQRAAELRSRRNRIIAFAVLGAIFVGLIAVSLVQRAEDQRKKEALLAEVQENLSELGCTPADELEDAGQGHLDGSTLAEQGPDVLYPDRPAASGQHYGNWLMTGVYDQLIDERVLVHNLEHGYVIAYYDEGAEDSDVAALKEYAQAQIDGKFKKLIVAPWDGDLSGEANFAYVAWNQRQLCAEYDTDTFQVFLEENHSGEGDAPEKTLSPHLAEGNGTIDPGDEPFLLPPLGQDEPTSEGMSEGGTVPSEGSS